MRAPEEKPVLKMAELNGNAFPVLGSVKQSLKRSGADQEYIDKYLSEAMSGDYYNLLAVSMEYVDFE